MIELVLQAPHVIAFRPSLFERDREGCVVLFTRAIRLRDGTQRLLSTDFVVPPATSYRRRGKLEAELSPEFVARVSKDASRRRLGLVFVHSHPGGEPPEFSALDDSGEVFLQEFLERRLPDRIHVAMVVSEGGYAARIVGQGTPVRVFEVGANRRILYDPNMSTEVDDLSQYDRQVRAFGIDAQVRLAQLKVAIVGLGGTGSVVAQELVHLGVRNFLLIDPDHVDHSNLNRLAGSSADDIAKLKVEVAARYIRDVNPNAAVECLAENVMRARVARRLADVDFFFGCTDSHGSRAVLQQISYQYLVPAIDIGSTIVVDRGRVTHVLGRVQMLAPGLACFTCSGLLNPNEVRRDMMTNVERLADPYIVGAREPAPAVMSLNATVASLAVTMLLSAITSIGGNARYLLYNLLGSSLRPVAPVQQPNCFICSRSGALAHGDDALLMARQD